MIRRLIERLTTFPFFPLSDATPPGHPAHHSNRTSWKRWSKAMRTWGSRFERTVPPRELTLTPQENFERDVVLLCPQHFDSPAILPGAVCPFDHWPEEALQ